MPKNDSLLRNVPDYFRLELSETSAAVLNALQASFEQFSYRELMEAASPSVLGTSRRRMVEDLSRAGFSCSTLNDAEVVRFSGMRHSLLAQAHSLTGVRHLADIFFPGASVQRGRPYPRNRLQTHHRLRLGDRGERRTVVSVVLDTRPQAERLNEFLSNCKPLLPLGMRMEARFRNPDSQRPSVWRLSGNNSGGRLTCRISHN
jgi:hypothetical protein